MDDAIKECARCGTSLDHVALEGLCPRCVALDMFTPAPDDQVILDAVFERPPFISNYEILEEIARGGMGVIYRARHTELDRVVAVKTILAGVLAGDEAINRFQRESTAVAALSHPNIVAIYEVGQCQGQHYFAMEYVAGPNLATLVREGPLPAGRAALYLRQIAEAVEYAHGRGVVHRDLKPSNILLDEHDRPRITDFGLAKRLDAAHDVTLSGQVLGTPAYTAPEQAGRKPAQVGPWSDIYGLGAVLYHLTTGRPPFTGESATEILAQVLAVEPIAPRLLHPALPRDLETICLKCLEKDPARRYQSARLLAEDLGSFLEDRPIRARPITSVERGWRWCKRKPGLALSLGIITLLLASIAILSTTARERIERLRLEGLVNLYASDMRLAQQAISESKFGAAAALLDRHRPVPGDPDLRGFEWRHFQVACESEEFAALESHSNQVQRAAFSPDGKLFATASTDIQVWELATRRRLVRFPVGDFVWAFAFSPDSQQLVAGDVQGDVFRFDVADLSRAPVRLRNVLPWAIAFAWPDPHGKAHLLTHNQLLEWDGTTNQPNVVGQFTSGFARAQVAGNLAAVVAGPNRVAVWQLKPAELRREFVLPAVSRAAALSPDGTRLAVGDYSGTLRTWELLDGGRTNVFEAHRGLIETVVFSPDGERIASAGADQVIRVHEVMTGKLVTSRHGHRGTIMAMAFSPDGQWIVSGDKLGEVKLWNLKGYPRAPAHVELPHAACSADGTRVVIQNRSPTVEIRSSTALDQPVRALSLENGSWVLAAENGVALVTADGMLRSLGTNGAWKEHSTGERRFVPIGGSLASNGRFAALLLKGANAPFVWDLAEDHQVLFATNDQRWLSPTFSADSRRLVYGLPSGHVHIWELPSAREVNFFQAHKNNYAYACDLSPDGSRLATAGFDGTVKLWEVAGAKLLHEYRSSADAFWSVALAPDGRRIAAGTSESSIVLWDVPRGQEVATFQLGTPLAPVEGMLRFAPDGPALLQGSRVLHTWRAPKISL